jgi:hypothetical protein
VRVQRGGVGLHVAVDGPREGRPWSSCTAYRGTRARTTACPPGSSPADACCGSTCAATRPASRGGCWYGAPDEHERNAAVRSSGRCSTRSGAADRSTLAGTDTTAPVSVPILVLAADDALSAFRVRHEERLARTHPDVEVVRPQGSSHSIHDERAYRAASTRRGSPTPRRGTRNWA